MKDKGLIFDIKRFAVHDGPGIRTTVFFKGCPLGCWLCHNPESRGGEIQTTSRQVQLDGTSYLCEEVTGKEMTVREVVEAVQRDAPYYRFSQGGITLSGGEPLYQPDFCLALLRELKQMGFHTALDTTGFAKPEIIRKVMPFTDLFLFDLKLMDEEEHRKYTGESNQIILSNLQLLVKAKQEFVIRFPVIPGITDKKDNIEAMIRLFTRWDQPGADSPDHPKKEMNRISVDLLPYHNIAHNKYKRFGMNDKLASLTPPDKTHIRAIARWFEEAGLTVGIGG